MALEASLVGTLPESCHFCMAIFVWNYYLIVIHLFNIILSWPAVISESGGYDGGGGGDGDLTFNAVTIGIIAGCVAGVVLFAIVGFCIYHSKVVRPHSAVRPLHHKHLIGGNMSHTYVQDIYLPNMSDFHTPRNMPTRSQRNNGNDSDVLWARRVITMPPQRQSQSGC